MSGRDGGPAFPRIGTMESDRTDAPNYTVEGPGGMTLRDYFAGQALAGLIMRDQAIDTVAAGRKSYAFADAMLAAREASE